MASQEAYTPLIIWVDDNISHKVNLTDYAKGLGIDIHTFTSTVDSKAWMDQILGKLTLNYGLTSVDFLKANDSGDKIRVITDQARVEPRPKGEKGTWVNTHAGKELALYIRYDLGLKLPILIYTGEVGIIITRYIKNFDNAVLKCLEDSTPLEDSMECRTRQMI